MPVICSRSHSHLNVIVGQKQNSQNNSVTVQGKQKDHQHEQLPQLTQFNKPNINITTPVLYSMWYMYVSADSVIIIQSYSYLKWAWYLFSPLPHMVGVRYSVSECLFQSYHRQLVHRYRGRNERGFPSVSKLFKLLGSSLPPVQGESEKNPQNISYGKMKPSLRDNNILIAHSFEITNTSSSIQLFNK